MEDFFLDISYKNKTVRFKVVNPEAPLATLMDNLRHSIGEDGRLLGGVIEMLLQSLVCGYTVEAFNKDEVIYVINRGDLGIGGTQSL
jgi:hypothetical protein